MASGVGWSRGRPLPIHFTPYTSGVPEKVRDFLGCSYTICKINLIVSKKIVPLQQKNIGIIRHEFVKCAFRSEIKQLFYG